MNSKKLHKGQTLVEIMVAMAVFGLIAGSLAILTLNSLSSSRQGGERSRAQALAEEGIEAAKSIRQRAWNELTNGNHGIDDSAGYWQFSGTSNTIDKYTRIVKVEDVYRDVSGDIASAGTLDLHTKKITSTVSWDVEVGKANEVELVNYFTTWQSKDWIQTDWSGGDGQSIWSDTTMYDTGTDVDDSTVGELKLALADTGTWVNAGGTLITHTSDTDFDAGTFTNTVRTGTGDGASIVLDESIQWAEHINSNDGSQNLYDVIMLSTSSGWAVGASGKILNYDGTNWTEFTDLGSQDVNAISAISSTDIWSAGTSGKIWHYDGTSWSQDTDTGSETWNDIEMFSASQGWTVGDSGVVAEYDGSSWSKTTVPSSADIEGVTAVSATDVWAAGKSGRFWHYSDALAWKEHPNSNDTGQDFFDVGFVSATDAWAVAENGVIFNYDGTNWTEFTDVGSADFNALDVVSATDVWAVAENGKIYNYDGTSWSQDTDTGSEDWNGVDMISSSQGWAVGDSGAVAEYDGSNWNESTVPHSANIYNVVALSATNVWACGHSGRFWHYNGSSWSLDTDTGSERWYDIDAVSSSDIWAVGRNGVIAHYNGSSWDDSISSPTSQSLNGIYVISASDIWATGENGTIIHYDGSSWSLDTDTGNEDWNEIAMFSASFGFVVGDSGEIFEYSTSPSWGLDTDTGGEHWRAIEAVSANDIWAVGNSGAIAHYNGSVWDNTISSPTSENLNGIYVISASDIWATGENGTIIHYDGSSWSLDTDTGNEDWNEIAMFSASFGFVVGDNWEIFEHGTVYDASGTFVSSVIDGGAGSNNWGSVSWTEVLPSGGDITVATRSGDTAMPDGSWSSWSSELTNETGSSISSPDSRYIQYRLTLTRPTNPKQTPQLDDITIVYNAPTSEHLRGIDPVSASDIWAVGNNGAIIHYDGSSWTSVSSPVSNNLYDVDMLSASDGWAVGRSGKILHYDGSAWVEDTDTGGEAWNTVSMASSSLGFAGGNSSNNMAKYDGSTWTKFSGPVSDDINDIYMLSDGTGWAVGDSGKILYYDGSSWSEDSDQGSQNILGIYMISSSDGWAVGASGKIYHYDGSSWSEYTDTGSDSWESVVMANANTGWAFGDADYADRWDGSNWSSESIPTTQTIYDVKAISSSNAWAVGKNGTIIHFSQSGLYKTSGVAISSAFDIGSASSVQIIAWNESIPSCSPACEIKFQVRSAPDSSGSPGTWTDWYGAGGVGTYFTVAAGTLIPVNLNGNQWVQYRVEFTGDGSDTPVLQDITVNYTP